MSADLARLVQLQSCERRLAALERTRQTAPEAAAVAELTERCAKFAKLEGLLADRIAEVRRRVRQLELDLAAAQEARAAVRDKLYGGAITHPKELTQLEARLAELQQSIERQEKELLQAMELLETLRAQERKVKAGAEKAANELKLARERLEHRQSEWDIAEALLQQEIDELRAATDRSLLALYDNKKRTTNGEPLAVVRHGVCGGCGLELPLSVRALQGRGIAVCEHCGRILYWPE